MWGLQYLHKISQTNKMAYFPYAGCVRITDIDQLGFPGETDQCI